MQYRYTIANFNSTLFSKKGKKKVYYRYRFAKDISPPFKTFKNIFMIFIFFPIIFSQGIQDYTQYLQTNNNKITHSLVGNDIKVHNNRKNFRLLHWNKGSSNLDNKIDDLYMTLDDFKPDFMSIAEANMSFKNPVCIKGYNMETNRLHIMSTFTRSILLINNKISYTCRHDLEDPLISSIWLEVSDNKGSKILICSYYRQWSLPSELNLLDSGSKEAQLKRFNIFSKQISKATEKGTKIIIMTDDNINTIDTNKTNYLYNNELKTALQDTIIQYTLTVHNKLPTFFRSTFSNTCIDHIISNIPEKISNVTTYAPNYSKHNNRLFTLKSDHAMISATYSCKNIEIPPLFHKFRDQKLLTKQKLVTFFNSNSKINSIFNHDDPNTIADILINELNLIIETLSPEKLIQHNNNYAPWLNSDFFKLLAKKNMAHKKATCSKNNQELWREFRNIRNMVNKLNK